MNYADFFKAATEQAPYDYQCRLACGDDALLDNPETLTKGRECRSLLINIPTGLGKTAAVVLGCSNTTARSTSPFSRPSFAMPTFAPPFEPKIRDALLRPHHHAL